MIQCDHKADRIDYEGRQKVGTCVICGRRRRYDSDGIGPPEVISEGKPWNKLEHRLKHAYFEQHREEITADYWSVEDKRGGRDKFVCAKWGILSGTWAGLKRAWRLPIGARAKGAEAAGGSTPDLRVEPTATERVGKKREDDGHFLSVELGRELGTRLQALARHYCIMPRAIVRIAVIRFLDDGGRIV